MLIDIVNKGDIKSHQSGGFKPKMSLRQVYATATISKEALSVVDAFVGDKLDRKNLIYDRETGAAGHFDGDEVRFIIIGLAVRMREEEIYAALKVERDKAGRTMPSERSLSYYRKKYTDLIDEVWATFAMRIGDVYSYTDKVYRLGKWQELTSALEGYVVQNIKAGGVDKTLIAMTNLYMNAMRNINAEMGGVPLEKISTRKPSEDNEKSIVDGVDVKKVLEDLVNKRFEAQLPEPKKIENGIRDSVTELT